MPHSGEHYMYKISIYLHVIYMYVQGQWCNTKHGAPRLNSDKNGYPQDRSEGYM